MTGSRLRPVQLVCNASLYNASCAFAGKAAPYQAVHFDKHPQAGVYAWAAQPWGAMFSWDHNGTIDPQEPVSFLADDKLATLCNPVIAGRTLEVDTDTGIATVTTHNSTAKIVEATAPVISRAAAPFIGDVLKTFADYWQKQPRLSVSSGDYRAEYLYKAFRVVESVAEFVTISGMDGGDRKSVV